VFPKLEIFLIFILKGVVDDGDDDGDDGSDGDDNNNDDDDDNDDNDDVVENLFQDPDRSSLHETVIDC